MEKRCEYSTLTVPNELAYAGLAGKYVGEVAKKIGFEDQDRASMEHAVDLAVSTLIRYSFESAERMFLEISCERVPVGLKVVISDQGMPLDTSRVAGTEEPGREDGKSAPEDEFFHVKEYVDELSLHNLGPQGKETVLVKHLKNKSVTDYYEACELERYEVEEAGESPFPQTGDCTVRAMEPSDAIEVSKCVYKAYGYSYGYEHIYYPERLTELNRSGEMHSAVAVSGDNEVVGHCALMFHDHNSRIAEMGQGVVKPAFRGHGCFTRLSEYLIEKAKSLGLMGVYGQAVTNHTLSQRVGRRLGLKDCAIILGFIPPYVTFKGITERPSQRTSLVIHFKYLRKPAGVTIFPPSYHARMIKKLYEHIGTAPSIRTSPDSDPRVPETEPIIRTWVAGSMSVAHIEIAHYGKNIVREIRAKLKELCLRKIEVIDLYLDLCNPLTAELAGRFEALGFFFAGILPGAAASGDALILQYLNNVPIDYRQIKVASESTERLLSYVMEHDPNRG